MTIWEIDTGKKCIPVPPNLNARTYRTEQSIEGVAYSPDGRQLLTWAFLGVRVWDASTGAELATLAGESAREAAWSPDGRVAVRSGGSIMVLDPNSGQELFSLLGVGGSVAFSPDGSLLASGSGDGTVRLSDATRGQEVHTLNVGSPRGGNHRIDGLTLSPDGKLVGFAFADGKQDVMNKILAVKVRSVATGREILSRTDLGTVRGYPDKVEMAFSPDGKRFAVVTGDQVRFGMVRHWDLATGREGPALEASDDINHVTFSPDGNTIALDTRGRLSLRNLVDGREMLAVEADDLAMNPFAPRLAFSPDGSLAAVVCQTANTFEYDLRLLEIPSGKVVRIMRGSDGKPIPVPGGSTRSLAFSADGRQVLLCTYRRIIIWDAASGQLVHAPEEQQDPEIAAFSPDGSRLATTTRGEGEVALWDTATGQEVFTFKCPSYFANSTVMALAWSADGSTLVIADEFGDLRFWNAAPRTEAAQEARRAAWADYARDWHHRAAQDAERGSRWFAAAFHLRQLLAAQPADVEQLRERLKRCADNLRN